MIRYKYKIFVSRGEEILLIKEYLNIVKPMMETVEGSSISWGPKDKIGYLDISTNVMIFTIPSFMLTLCFLRPADSIFSTVVA